MSLSRRNLFKRGAAAAAVAATAPITRHIDVAALDLPENAAEFEALPAWEAETALRSPSACPTCYQPALHMAQLINHDAWVLRCERDHMWKVTGLEVSQMPRWMLQEWKGAFRAAKLRQPDRATSDVARGRLPEGTVNAMDYYG